MHWGNDRFGTKLSCAALQSSGWASRHGGEGKAPDGRYGEPRPIAPCPRGLRLAHPTTPTIPPTRGRHRMTMTYATLTGAKTVPGSIMSWVNYAKLDIEQVLEEAQAVIFQ